MLRPGLGLIEAGMPSPAAPSMKIKKLLFGRQKLKMEAL
jgi:hypothetical protein